MGVRILAAVFIASVSGVAALAASLPVVRIPVMHVSESVSAGTDRDGAHRGRLGDAARESLQIVHES